MFDLTAEQQIALESGEPVTCVIGATECVVVRKDVFQRMQHVAYDDSEWTAEEMTILAARTFDDLGDPEEDIYSLTDGEPFDSEE
jgi:hypothetical protein